MNATIVRLKNKQEAAQLLSYLAERGISRRSVVATIRHDKRMARQLLGTALIEMRSSKRGKQS